MLNFEEAAQVFQSLNSDQLNQLAAFKAAELVNGLDLMRQEYEFGERFYFEHLNQIRKILCHKKGVFGGLVIDISEGKLPELIDYLAAEYRKGKTKEFHFFEEKICIQLEMPILEKIDFLAEGFDYFVTKAARRHVQPMDKMQQIILLMFGVHIT